MAEPLSPVTAEPTRWRDDIEGFRAWAIVPVLLYHFDPAWLPGGFLGVDVFFVISGYLMAAMTLGRRSGSAVAALRVFLLRRTLRILPALAVVLGVSAVAFAFVLLPRMHAPYFVTAASALVGASNLQLAGQKADYFAAAANDNPFLHTWSISVELQFYLVFGLALFALMAALRSDRARRLGLACVATAILLIGFYYHPATSPSAYFDLFARLWEFMLGTLAFLAEPLLVTMGKRWRGVALWGSLAVLWASMAGPGIFPGAAAANVAAVLAAAVVLLVGAAAPAWAASALTVRPVRWLGRVSYSAYLVHFPVLKWVELNFDTGPANLPALGLYLATTLLLAWACFRWVEEAYRIRGDRSTQSYRWKSMLALWAGSLVSIVAVAQLSPRISVLSAWDDRLDYARVEPVLEGEQGEVMVVGDSHAQQLFPAFRAVSAEHGVRFVNKTGSACLFTDEYSYVRNGLLEARCLDPMRSYIDALKREGGGRRVLFVGMRSLAYLSPRMLSTYDSPVDGLIGKDGFIPVADHRAMDAYGRSLERIATELQAHRVRMLFLAPLPELRVPTYACLMRPDKRECGVAKTDALAHRARFMEILARIERQVPAFEVWDPFDLVCPEATCSNLRANRAVFRDDDHLSKEMAAALSDDLWHALHRTLEAAREAAAPAPKAGSPE